jgi:hypothetical protein
MYEMCVQGGSSNRGSWVDQLATLSAQRSSSTRSTGRSGASPKAKALRPFSAVPRPPAQSPDSSFLFPLPPISTPPLSSSAMKFSIIFSALCLCLFGFLLLSVSSYTPCFGSTSGICACMLRTIPCAGSAVQGSCCPSGTGSGSVTNGVTDCFEPQSCDGCAGITCQNGGTCSNGRCNCVYGYWGTNCQNRHTVTSMVIYPTTSEGIIINQYHAIHAISSSLVRSVLLVDDNQINALAGSALDPFDLAIYIARWSNSGSNSILRYTRSTNTLSSFFYMASDRIQPRAKLRDLGSISNPLYIMLQ